MRLIFMAIFTPIFISALSQNQLFATSVEMPEIYGEEKERLWRLRLEGRFFDETAATFSVSYKF